MNDSDYRAFVETKIAEAKLEVTEKRYQNLWLLFSVVGVVIPIGLAIFSAIDTRNRVDDQVNIMDRELLSMQNTIENQKSDYNLLFTQLTHNIEQALSQNVENVNSTRSSFEQRFKDLSGGLLKGPSIECVVDGNPIEGQVFKVSKGQNTITIGLKNVGDKPSENIKVTLYTNIPRAISLYGNPNNEWEELERSDEPAYQNSYRIRSYEGDGLNLDPLESKYIGVSFDEENLKPAEISMMLKIHYGQPKPSIFPFKIIVGN